MTPLRWLYDVGDVVPSLSEGVDKAAMLEGFDSLMP